MQSASVGTSTYLEGLRVVIHSCIGMGMQDLIVACLSPCLEQRITDILIAPVQHMQVL